MINYHIRLWGTASTSTTMASNVKKCQYLIATVVVDVARKYYHVSPKRTKMGEDQASLQYVYHRVQGNARHLLNFFFSYNQSTRLEVYRNNNQFVPKTTTAGLLLYFEQRFDINCLAVQQLYTIIYNTYASYL